MKIQKKKKKEEENAKRANTKTQCVSKHRLKKKKKKGPTTGLLNPTLKIILSNPLGKNKKSLELSAPNNFPRPAHLKRYSNTVRTINLIVRPNLNKVYTDRRWIFIVKSCCLRKNKITQIDDGSS